MTTEQRSDSEYLTSYSPKDAKFDLHKPLAEQIAYLYGLAGDNGQVGFLSGNKLVTFHSYQTRIQLCGSWLKFWKTAEDCRLIDARFCKVPYCPMCQWRRALKWRAKFLAALPTIQDKYPTHKWLFLTLTVRNCQMSELRSTIKHMGESFNRLSKLAAYPFDGCIKSLEVTRIWDWYDQGNNFIGRHGTKWYYEQKDPDKHLWSVKPTDEVHPHFHILALVPASYFGKAYVNHEQWSEMWKQSLKISYVPIINIKTVKNKNSQNKALIPTPEEVADKPLELIDSGIVQGLCETLKYTVKEQDLIGKFCTDENINSDWLKAITEELYRLRRVEYRGVLKEFGKDVEKSLENLVDIDEEKDELPTEEGTEVIFWYCKFKKRYTTKAH